MGEVDARILAKVVEYCKFHHHQETNQTSTEEVDRWEKNFVQVDKSTLFQLILVRFIYLHSRPHIYDPWRPFTNSATCVGGQLSRHSISARPHLQNCRRYVRICRAESDLLTRVANFANRP